MIESPMNYTGGKSRLLSQILPKFPKKINTFIDLFCGGCNVGLNVKANKVCYNDYNHRIIELYNELKRLGTDSVVDIVYDIIEKYNLSLVSKYGYSYYNCNSSDGVGKYNRDKFNRLRKDYNELIKHKSMCVVLYVLIVYAFNNQIRFNKRGEFNLPVGKRDFNSKMEEKLKMFTDTIQEQECDFTSYDFRDYDFSKLGRNDFVYIDPPYLITCASYNENGGWTEKDENDLLLLLDNLDNRKIKFALSNVFTSKGRNNILLIDWVRNHNNYKVYHLDYNYLNCNYHISDKSNICDEVLIVNY